MRVIMKKALMVFLILSVLLASMCPPVYADISKGQKVYKKFLKKQTGVNGGIFAMQHTSDEWKDLFENNLEGLKKECIGKYPETKSFFESENFGKFAKHLEDFLIYYASDSGNIPDC